MKNLFRLITFLLLTLFTVKIQAQQSCCQQFASFASNRQFVDKHDEPLEHQYKGKEGKYITFSTLDGKTANAFFIKSAKPTDKYLFVFHEWWGLNGYVKEEAAWYAQQIGSINVLAIDLYDGKVATTREEASEYMKGMNEERGKKIVEGAMAYAGKKARIVTLGWCFGGSWSLQAAINMGKKTKGCVMYYGMPETDTKKLKQLNSDVLGIFAAQDQWITPQIAQAFEANMKSVGKKSTIKIFEADHAFANPSNPKHHKAFADEARKLSVQYIKDRLKMQRKAQNSKKSVL